MTNISDTEAAELLSQYSTLVRRIAKSACYSSASIGFEDLCQVGNLAILKAAKLYNPTYGTSIKSFIAYIVRRDIYHEAARFLGIFTVDYRVTNLASRISKLFDMGKNDKEIAVIINKQNSHRHFDAAYVRDLRIAYNYRQQTDIKVDDLLEEDIAQETTIQEFLYNLVRNNVEHILLEKRLLGNASIKEVAELLHLSQRRVYSLENNFKDYIRQSIEGITE